MAYKRRRVDSGKRSTTQQPSLPARTSRVPPSNASALSSPGFQTPLPQRLRNARGASSQLGSTSLNSRDFGSSPVLPALPTRKRVSLRPPNSHVNTSSPAQPLADEHNEVFESEIDMQQREDADALNEIVMAVDRRERGTVGCAYYIAREERLCLMEDIKLAGIEIVDTLKLHAQPTVLLISTRADEVLEEHLSKESRGADGDYDSSRSTSFFSSQRRHSNSRF